MGTALLERLVRASWRVGIREFEADALLSNQRMIAVFDHLGFPVSSHFEAGVAHVTVPITSTADYKSACENRRSTLVFDDDAQRSDPEARKAARQKLADVVAAEKPD